MTDDLALFGDDPRQVEEKPENDPAMAVAWQRDLIRKSLDALGLATTQARRQAVEQAAGRPVQSLSELTHDEALVVLKELGRPARPTEGRVSAWESREADTWIDRM